MATKLLEITFFDLKFVHQSLGHGIYQQEDIICLENRIAQLTNWNYTQSSQLDFHSLLLGMIKVRMPPILSTVLYRVVTNELDVKFLYDLKLTLCVPSICQIRPLLKIAGMLAFKISQLAEIILRDFPFETVNAEIRHLQAVWQEIVSQKLLMKVQDLESVGSLVYGELRKFRNESKADRHLAALCLELSE